jgi:hypothetical protein
LMAEGATLGDERAAALAFEDTNGEQWGPT